MEKETDAAREAREAQEAMDREDADLGAGGEKATDGEPNGVADLSKARGRRGKPVSSQLSTDGSEDGQAEDPDGQQAWEPEPGKRMSLGSLIAKGKPVEFKTTVKGTGVKLKGGINDPAAEQIAVSRLYVEGYDVRYTRDSDGQIEKTTVTEIKAARTVDPARSEAGQLVLANMGSAQDAATG